VCANNAFKSYSIFAIIMQQSSMYVG